MKVERFSLNNGVRVVYLNLPIESVSLVVSVGVGYRDEDSSSLGVSHLLEHLVFDGSRSYPTEFEFSEAAENLGGEINGTTEEYLTSFEIKSSKENFLEAAKIISELVQYPLFLKENFEKEKKVIKAEMVSRRDFFKKNPVKTVLYGYLDGFDEMDYLNREIKNIDSLKEEQVLKHFNENYHPKNMVLGVVGNIEDLKENLEKFFDKNNTSNKARVIPKFNFPSPKVERISDTEEVKSIFFTWFGPGMFESERAVFDICAKIISKGENGVVKAIRFDEGLAYEVDAFLNDDEQKGVFIVSVKTNSEHMDRVEGIVKEKVFAVKNVSEKEVEAAKKSVLAEEILKTEDYLDDAREISNFELYNKPTPFEGYIEELRKVTANDIKKFAEKYLNENFVLITSKK
jgi:predicted Zn-dependent peptidase